MEGFASLWDAKKEYQLLYAFFYLLYTFIYLQVPLHFRDVYAKDPYTFQHLVQMLNNTILFKKFLLFVQLSLPSCNRYHRDLSSKADPRLFLVYKASFPLTYLSASFYLFTVQILAQ